MKNGLSLERLQSFLSVVEHGGFAAAAPRQPVRQSQLSRQVTELEEHFGRPLLARQGRGVAPTPAGETLAELTRALLAGLDDVRREADEPLSFTLGAGDSVLHWWVLPRLGELQRHRPPVSPSLVSLASKDVVAQLEDGRLDFGIVRATELPPTLESRPLGALAYGLYVPVTLSPKARSLPLAELLATVPLALQHSEDGLNDALLALADGDARARVALRCETFPQAFRAVQSGHYAALLPTLVDGGFDPGTVRAIELPRTARHECEVRLAWHARTARRSERHAKLAAVLARSLTRPPGKTARQRGLR